MNKQAIDDFLAFRDENGVSNLEKIQANQHVIRRVESTDKSKSYEDSDNVAAAGEYPPGIVMDGGKLIGFGIHIIRGTVYIA